MEPKILRAHFDGEKIVLDEPADLQPDTNLIVTVLSDSQRNGGADGIDKVHEDWSQVSLRELEYAYGDDEPEYGLELLKEPNPLYEGR